LPATVVISRYVICITFKWLEKNRMSDALAPVSRPEWTEYRKKNELDPLGMQNTSVGLYQKLLPGISNVTLRVWYYGFYAWLSSIYAERVRDTDPKTWQRFIRRTEALYALTSQRRGSEHGVAGIQWAQRRLDGPPAAGIDFADDAEPGSLTHDLKQPWGAYGAAYGSQLFEVGIFSAAAGHQIPVPSPEIGEALAQGFATEFGNLANRYVDAITEGEVSFADLDAFTPMTPSGIQPNGVERKLYQDLLFAEAGLARTEDLNRRKSLLLILNLAQQLGHAPDTMDVRWALYARCLPDETPLVLPEDLERHRQRWRVYQANDLAHICFETLLKYMLDRLEAHPGGIPLARLIADAVAEILASGKPHPQNWAAFLNETVPASNAWSSDSAMTEASMVQEVMKAGRGNGFCRPDGAWAALRLLAVLHNRVRGSQAEIWEDLGTFKLTSFRSLLTEVAFLETHIDEAFDEMVTRLIEERVIRRHLWIALQKFRYQGDYTFLIETDDGRIRLRDKDGPVFTNPRLATTITFLKDINLLGDGGLTALGHQRIETP
jgi:hypothetical protein